MADYISKFTGIEVDTLLDAASTQPDWNQNDDTAIDYIKNRTHYTTPAYTDYHLLSEYYDFFGGSIQTVDELSYGTTSRTIPYYPSYTKDGTFPLVRQGTITKMSQKTTSLTNPQSPNFSKLYIIYIDNEEIWRGKPYLATKYYYYNENMTTSHVDVQRLGGTSNKIIIDFDTNIVTNNEDNGLVSSNIDYQIYLTSDLAITSHNISIKEENGELVTQIPTKYIDYSVAAPAFNTVNTLAYLSDQKSAEFLVKQENTYYTINKNTLAEYILNDYYNYNLLTNNKNSTGAVNELYNKFNSYISNYQFSVIQQSLSHYVKDIEDLTREIEKLKKQLKEIEESGVNIGDGSNITYEDNILDIDGKNINYSNGIVDLNSSKIIYNDNIVDITTGSSNNNNLQVEIIDDGVVEISGRNINMNDNIVDINNSVFENNILDI